MERYKRSDRLVYITKHLLCNPGKSISLSYFTGILGAAKSSISEDLTMIKLALDNLDMGKLETELGATGGVTYIPHKSKATAIELAKELCGKLRKDDRIIPGGFIYMTDITFSPQVASEVGEIFATCFRPCKPDYVVTVETKGVPLALFTAYYLGIPLLVARREQRVTEGSTVSIAYVSGSSRRLQTMSLNRRSLSAGAKIVVMDDFMKAGGTAKGMHELIADFKAEVVGTGVLMETSEPGEKLIDKYTSLLVLEGVDEERKKIMVRPSSWLLNGERKNK